MSTIDPIQLEIYWSRAIAIANEMMATLIRTSFSTVIRVNRDCSAAVFDERGQMLAQPDHSAPAHIGCMPFWSAFRLRRFRMVMFSSPTIHGSALDIRQTSISHPPYSPMTG